MNNYPPGPTVPGTTICAGETATLTATSAGGTYQWFDVPSRGNPIATTNTFTTPVLNRTTTYYVDNSINGCTSPRTPVTVTVNQIPPGPMVPGIAICAGSTAVLTPVSPGGTYTWYDAPVNGNLLASTTSFTSPALDTTTIYYVQATINGCTSSRTPVTVTVLQIPPAPVASGATICAGTSVTLTATGSGEIFEWYDAPSGGNMILRNPQYTPPPLFATTTYYVQTSFNNCISTRTPVTVTVIPVPPAPSVSGTTICPGTAATLTATSSENRTYQWYDAAIGGNLLSSMSTFTTPALTRNTTYYVQTTLNGCTSARTAVTVSVTDIINPAFRYASGTYCGSGTDPVPEIYSPDGGTFSSSPNGLVFISNTTGQIDLSESNLGTYLISFVSNGPCPYTTTTSITLTETANASFSYAGPYCQGAPINAPATFITGASAGSFTSSPAGLVLTSDGAINLRESLPGTYTVTNTIPASGLCAAVSSSAVVTINPEPVVNAGPDQTVSFGNNVTLSGSTSAPTYRWSGGSGTFSNPTILNPIYTPAVNEASATLYLSTSGPGVCGPETDSVLISINSVAPIVSGAAICSGTSATISATPSDGTYQWYDAPSGGNLLLTNPTYVTPPLTVNTTYYVQRMIGGYPSVRAAATVTIIPIPESPTAPGLVICAGNTATLNATAPGGTYQWYNAASGGDLLSTAPSFTTPILTSTTVYYVQTTVNGCTSTRTAVPVTVNASPLITSAAKETICNGTSLNYTITADLPGTGFIWSRAAVPNVSNPALSNQTSSVINETLLTTATIPVEVTYIITPVYNSCTGPSFAYVVTVDPTPVVTSASAESICNNTASNYTITFNMPGTGFSWSRAPVPGISNLEVSGQRSGTIREVLTNTTNVPVNVTYVFNHSFNGCVAPPFNYVVTVNPVPAITSAPTNAVCSGTLHSYLITSDVNDASFSWSRDAVTNISNPPVTNNTTGQISETLINTGNEPIDVLYRINAISNGCTSPDFIYRVTVNPIPATPVIISNSQVCINSVISLNTPEVLGAGYLWTGPNGFTSTLQNPIISNVTQANSGQYRLTVTVNGCTSSTAVSTIQVNELPLTSAGNDQTICIISPVVTLSGSVTGGTSTGIWTSSGTGTFSPANTALNASYIPSAADRSSGSVLLTLTSTSPDDCIPSVSSITVTFEELPVVQAGPDQDVCSQNSAIRLNGNITISPGAVWSSSGTGTFNPSNTALDATYVPGNADIARGSVILTLSATGSNTCLPVSDQLTVNIIPPPVIDMGPTIFVPLNRPVHLNPSVNDPNVQYLWTPDINLSDNTVRNPVLTGINDQTYTLTVTDSRGCVTQEDIFIDVLMPIVIPNTFTPNGDGINDVWNISELTTYPGNTVTIYNRYGVKIYSSEGYIQSWDGTYNGEPAPVGTYYYVINTRFPDMMYSGSITILR
ncbi:MAG TPA: PKD-like domain-containing protein [Sphingobacteriaceae bacterium]